MIPPCEIASKTVIPAIKATIAIELVERHRLKQNHIAQILGISQSAVSKYTRGVRGHIVRIESTSKIQPLIANMVNLLLEENTDKTDFLKLFCQTCSTIRQEGLMCQFCQRTEPKAIKEECRFCFDFDPPSHP